MITTYEILLKVMKEKFGIFIFSENDQDFALSDYIVDSISFIEFIVAIEVEFKLELSDDFLDFDILGSARGFVEKLDFYINSLENGISNI
jgi:acyl carrier protein